jgi:hypothetical protein
LKLIIKFFVLFVKMEALLKILKLKDIIGILEIIFINLHTNIRII